MYATNGVQPGRSGQFNVENMLKSNEKAQQNEMIQGEIGTSNSNENNRTKRQHTTSSPTGETSYNIGPTNSPRYFTPKHPAANVQTKKQRRFVDNDIDEDNDIIVRTERDTNTTSNPRKNAQITINNHMKPYDKQKYNSNPRQSQDIRNPNVIISPQQPRHEITPHAVNYAMENHLPPIKIGCEPKASNHQTAKEIVTQILSHIEKNVRSINKKYDHPLGFDYWFVDKEGNIICYTKHIELFVFLCNASNYLQTINNTAITPNKPRHLPAQLSLVLKFVPVQITTETIKQEISNRTHDLFNIEEMKGSINMKTRHLRIDIASTADYEKLLNSGGLAIDGNIIEIQEFLAPPKLLLCSKCNGPGHVKRDCHFDYEACHRCGNDRTLGEHKQCTILCHRCNQSHLATNYSCPALIEYRKALIQHIRMNPHLIPPNVKLLVPRATKNIDLTKIRQPTQPQANLSHLSPPIDLFSPHVPPTTEVL